MVVEPGAAQDENVDAAVVVVVGLDHVESADDAGEAGLLGHPREGAVSVVVEVLQLIPHAHVRDHQIEVAVVVEVLEDQATSDAELPDPPAGRDVGEAADVRVRLEDLRRNQPVPRHLFRILAQRHVADVEQPAVGKRVLRIGVRIREELAVQPDRLRRSQPPPVDAVSLHREEARIGVVVGGAVLGFSEAEVGERQLRLDRFGCALRKRLAQLLLQLFEHGQGALDGASVKVMPGNLALELEALDRIRFRVEGAGETDDLLLRLVPLVVPDVFALGQGGELRAHVEASSRAAQEEDSCDRDDGCERDCGGGLERHLSRAELHR